MCLEWRSPAALLLLPALLLAAPVPSPRPRKVPPVTPGAYVLVWGGTEWGMWLGPDGSYRCSSGSAVTAPGYGSWRGHWWYDPKGHTLHVYEVCGDYTTWAPWRVTLDADWRRVEAGAVSVSLRRVR